jgi:phosphoribosylformylglycinamidine cyclo-ligase
LKEKPEGFDDILGEVLLAPTKIYVKPVLELISKYDIRGIAHITGGGFLENIPRILPEGMTAKIAEGSWPVKKVFLELQRTGNIEKKEMYRTFNMGIGMILVVPEDECDDILKALEEKGEESYLIGEIVKGEQGIIID